VAKIEDVAQVVDGLWTIEGDRVRPVGVDEDSYDRLIAIGDTSWVDYEVTVPITIHQFYGDLNPGVGILVRWNGHGEDAEQPHYAHPFGGLGWYQKRPTSSVYRLYILGNGGGLIATDFSGRQLVLETEYIFKMRVETEPAGDSLYSFKVWEASEAEPTGWELSGYGNDLDPDEAHGSILLVAHRTDASFGDVTISPLVDIAPPVISDIQVTPGETTATITWTTNEGATSSVAYGTSASYELGVETDSALVTSHTITLSGLSPDTLYHYQITSVDGSSNGASSTDLTFTTDPAVGGHTLTVYVEGLGQVTKNPDLPTYSYNDEVELTATPNSGWRFDSWSGGLGSTSPVTVTITGNQVITATFVEQQSGTDYQIYLPIVTRN
jgi:hypothetical protein